MRYLNLIIIFLCAMTSSRCISPIEQDLDEPLKILVVEGFIDDDFGPHEVQISMIAKFASAANGGSIERVDANVRIFDDLGNSFPLRRRTEERIDLFNRCPEVGCLQGVSRTEVISNYLTSPDFRGVAGRSYTLEIQLNDGSLYLSKSQRIPESPLIDSIFVQFAEISADNKRQPTTGVEVFASWQDDPNEENFYFWQINGTYKIETPDRTSPTICCLYLNDGFGQSCWVEENNIPGATGPFVDNFVDGNQVIGLIGFVEDDGRRFASLEVPPNKQYYVEAEQFVMNEEAFRFFNNIDILSEINGEIFDPPPIGSQGNIINVTDPNEEVVGFFGAFGKRTASTFVPRSMLRSIKRHGSCGDCRIFINGQLEVPEPYR